MPELPEVETSCRGIAPHITEAVIKKVIIRHYQLRWPIDKRLARILSGQRVINIARRAKYILLYLSNGTLLLHLGMSGKLCVVDHNNKAKKHDHVDIQFSNNLTLRYHDPRRFGAIVWTEQEPLLHPLLSKLGPEPLSRNFSARYLLQQIASKRTAIKQLIMDAKIVVGVGNIYANEALFYAGIDPTKRSQLLDQTACQRLVAAIKKVLKKAIDQGGTTLKDFRSPDGSLGYFVQQLAVYGRSKEPCISCSHLLQEIKIGGRSTVYCSNCQH